MAKSISKKAPTSHVFSTASVARPLLEAHNRCNDLRGIKDAYSALENFIAPEFGKRQAEVQANRCELHALLALMNAETGRRIETAIRAVELAREVDLA